MSLPVLISAQPCRRRTSAIAPEMMHAAARVQPYACFAARIQIPFMAMPDGVEALLQLASVPAERLTRTEYNVSAFNPSADEIRGAVVRFVPDAQITWETDAKRHRIVDSWPADSTTARSTTDWGSPALRFATAFTDYLIQMIRERYS